MTIKKQLWGWVIPKGGKKKPVILSADNHDEISAITEAEIHGLGYFALYSDGINLEGNPWTSSVQGPGSGPHSSGGDGAWHPSCRACGGLQPGKSAEGSFIASAIGHKKDCPYAR